jgi:chromosome segregation ATPase
MNDRIVESEFLDYEKGDEQSNLIAIMENNEKILNLSQVILAKDKQNLLKELMSTESLYKVQVKSLSEENKTYQQEIGRLNQKVLILTEKLENLVQELKKSKEKNAIIGHSLLETSQKLLKFEDKYKKLDKFYKEKESKLQGELKKTQSSLSVIEMDFTKKLENLTEKPLKSVEKSVIPKDQVSILIEQKKEIEKNFLKEKTSLNEELKKSKKKIRELEKMLETEKQAKNSCEVQIRVLKGKELQLLNIKENDVCDYGLTNK